MNTLETINDVRKAIKPLGYKLKTNQISWGRAVTYIHIATNTELNFNVFTADSLATWKPLLDWLKDNREQLRVVRDNEGCIGLVK